MNLIESYKNYRYYTLESKVNMYDPTIFYIIKKVPQILGVVQ